jgi:hypothetical protein
MTDKKKIRELVETLLEKQGKFYEDWLYQKQMEFIAENSDIVMSALNGKKESN